MRLRRGNSGFTLIELLVVLGILALMLAVVPPLLPRLLESMQVKAAAREILNGLRETRGIAVRSGREATFTIDVQERRYVLGQRARSMRLPDDATLHATLAQSEMISEDEGAIRFFPDGSSTGGRITLSRGAQVYRMDVNWITGRTTVTP